MRRNSKGQFVKGSGAKRTTKKGTAKKGTAKKGTAKKKSSERSLDGRVERLERAHLGLVRVVSNLEQRVSEHDRAIAAIGSVVGERYRPKSKRGR